MRIVCLSDTHSLQEEIKIPEGDMLIHAGDFTSRGKEEEIIAFNYWLGKLDFQYKVIIAGNHDFLFDKEPEKAEKLITNATYLNDSEIIIEGIKVWGSPITPWFFGMAFNRQRGKKIRRHWKNIPEDTDILITHGPPQKILDKTFTGINAGCEDLRGKVEEIKPKVHIFGHIHEEYGQETIDKTLFINASNLDLKYQPINPAIVVDYVA